MANEPGNDTSFGVVVIGRNEGERLKACLTSASKHTNKLTYVDSGSRDDSVNMALAAGAAIVDLDMALPFTAARARNEGFRRLCELYPELCYVQFVDGDCELIDGWLNSAVDYLGRMKNVAVVFGQTRERYPESSVYNMLCDIEWSTPVGEAQACGGGAMMRVDAFNQVSGFKEDLIAGEEPELCIRLRKSGWKIWRIEHEMMLHDAGMTHFGQWLKRCVRAGYTYAEGMHLHGSLPERHGVREFSSAWFWSLLIPGMTIIFAYLHGAWSLVLLAIYPFQILRLTSKGNRAFLDNFLRAFYLVLGKFPEMLGTFKFMIDRVSKTRSKIIEYK